MIMQRLDFRIKNKYISLYLCLRFSGDCKSTKKVRMKLKEFSVNYRTPHTEIIEMEVETAILSASIGNVENPVEGEESGW